jgi:hypothetical protein
LRSLFPAVIIDGPHTLYKTLQVKPPGLDGLDVKVMTSIIGSCIYYGKINGNLSELEVNHDYLVTEANFEKITIALSNHILLIVKSVKSASEGIVDGIYIATPARNAGEEGEPQAFKLKDLQSKTDINRYVNAVKAAIVGKRRIYIKCIYRTSMDGKVKYLRVTRYFTLYQRDGANIRSFAFYPCDSLVRGVFWSKEQALLYMSLYQEPSIEQIYAFSAPFLAQLRIKIKEAIEMKSEFEAYRMLITLIAIENKSEAYIPDIRRALNGSAPKFHARVEEILVLVEMIKHYQEQKREANSMADPTKKSKIIESLVTIEEDFIAMYIACKKSILDLLKSGLVSDTECVGSYIEYMMKSLEAGVPNGSFTLANVGAEEINRLYKLTYFLKSIELSLYNDLSHIFDGMESSVKNYLQSAITDNKNTKDADTKPKVKEDSKALTNVLPTLLSQFGPDGGLVINITKETKRSIDIGRYPLQVARELTLLQYVVDTRLDLCLHELHFDLINGTMIPRPFKLSLENLKKWCQRFILCKQTDKFLSEKFAKYSLKLVELSSCTYEIKVKASDRFGLYGTVAAGMMVDPDIVLNIIKHLPAVKNSSEMSLLPGYTEKIITCFKLETIVNSRFIAVDVPKEVHVSETYLFQGAELKKAIQQYSKHVMKYLQMMMESRSTILSLQIGEQWRIKEWYSPSEGFSAIQIKNDAPRIENEIIRITLLKQPLMLSAVLDYGGRCVPLLKEFCFSFHESLSHSITSFIPASDMSLYHGVFTSKDDARDYTCAYFQKSSSTQDPMDFSNYSKCLLIIQKRLQISLDSGNIMQAYKWLFLISLLREDLTYIPEISRMLGSSVAVLDYYNNSMIKPLVMLFSAASINSEIIIDVKSAMQQVTLFGKLLQPFVESKELLSLQGVWSKVIYIIGRLTIDMDSENISGLPTNTILGNLTEVYNLIDSVVLGDACSIAAISPRVKSYLNVLRDNVI